MEKFKLSEVFLEGYKGRQPAWGYDALSYFTFKRTYARNLPNGGTEEYWQTLQRVVEGSFTIQKMHCASHKLFWDNRRAQRSAQKMFEKMWEFKFLPPGRGLWAMGTPMLFEKGTSMPLYNCGFVSTENIDKEGLASPFCWMMDALMLGVGVGFDTKGAGLVIKAPTPSDATHIIPDTREGWVEALEITLLAYMGNRLPKFDFSKIRRAGELIKGFGGYSSGPEPLILLLDNVRLLLEKRVGEELTSVDIVDIANFIGKCVVAGNVRRSAELAIGNYDDKPFIECKDPEKYPYELNDRRWSSNNSIFAKLGMDFSYCAERTARNGEPGYIFEENIKNYGRMNGIICRKDANFKGLNPCVEIVLEDKELCNVVETFPANHNSPEEFYDTLKYAYLYAKSVTLMSTHEPRTNAVMLRNRRIGISQSGIEQAKKKFGSHAYYTLFCDKGYDIIKEWDNVYSDWLCVPRSKRISTVKPSGTVSLLAGATPGIHYSHAMFYYRTIRVAKNSPLIKSLANAGYRIEPAATDPNNTCVVYFPIYEKNFTKSKSEVSIWEQMENIAKMQRYWSDNSVSATVTFQKHEQDEIKNVLDIFQDQVKVVSFLPLEDHGYVQAPYIEIDGVEYDKAVSNLKSLVFEEEIRIEDRKDTKYCANDKCEI